MSANNIKTFEVGDLVWFYQTIDGRAHKYSGFVYERNHNFIRVMWNDLVDEKYNLISSGDMKIVLTYEQFLDKVKQHER